MSPPALRRSIAGVADAAAIAALRTRAAEELTRLHGPGHWSRRSTPRGVLKGMRDSVVLLAKDGDVVAGTLRLNGHRPWAIDAASFTSVARPLYLTNMAVDPDFQGLGVGRFLVAEAEVVARDWPADALRLDAYDAAAGAGGFYARCGWRETGRATRRGIPFVYFERLLS